MRGMEYDGGGDCRNRKEEGWNGDYRAWLGAQAYAACRYKFIC